MTPRRTRSPSIPGPLRCGCAAAEAGFTLIEAVVALLILGTAVVGIVQAMGATLHARHATERAREGLAVAEWRMNVLALSSTDSLRHYLLPRDGSAQVGERRYGWRAVARQNAQRPALWSIGVTVTWDGGRVTLESIRFLGPTAPAAGNAPSP